MMTYVLEGANKEIWDFKTTIFQAQTLEKVQENRYYPSFIYSWSISHILEHEFFWAAQGSKAKNCRTVDIQVKFIFL